MNHVTLPEVELCGISNWIRTCKSCPQIDKGYKHVYQKKKKKKFTLVLTKAKRTTPRKAVLCWAGWKSDTRPSPEADIYILLAPNLVCQRPL
ncbi:hypothetical protein BaRGS_00026139 [Batillaria attramentaria]|uniref:Uncharacterized protein n=1 Tax=Batillaria attramentaria TaxID=370345 RepID=A0ABD0K744_9CAEN